jgi:hypothetical protein
VIWDFLLTRRRDPCLIIDTKSRELFSECGFFLTSKLPITPFLRPYPVKVGDYQNGAEREAGPPFVDNRENSFRIKLTELKL